MGQQSVMRYTVGYINKYHEFIDALREKLAKSKKDGSKEEIKVGEHFAAVLPKLGELNKQDQLLYIELHAKKPNSNDGSWTTTLAMRKDNLYIVGFTGKDGKWFEIADSRCKDKKWLPEEYRSTLLHWDDRYKSIMNLKDKDQVKRTLSKTRLGMAFAMRAVRRLSQYPDHDGDENPTRLGLAGLIVLICESARMESIRKEFQNKKSRKEWEKEGVVIKKDVLDYIWNWGTLSAGLMRWKNRDYKEEYRGSNLHDALDLRLVLNSENVDGGARVEIFAVSDNFDVTSIIVTDDTNTKGHTIYNHKVRQMEQGKETPTKNKLFVTCNTFPQDYIPIIEKAVKQSSLEISDITMGSLSDRKIDFIIIQFRNEELAESAFRHMSHELDKEVTISLEDPRIKDKEMVDLELNVVPNGISGYKWFDLDIKFKSQGADATEHVTWRLNCRKQGGDATEVVTRNIDFGSQRKMDVTYLVMSDTVRAKVEVRLGYKYWPYPADIQVFHGEIVARIDGFDHRIVLLRINDKSEAKAVEPWHTFPLDRSDVWVPRGSKRVHIEMKHLHVTLDGDEISIPDSLSFVFNLGDLRPSSGDDDSTVDVNIAWDGTPQKESTVQPDVAWIVGDDAQAFTRHIVELREKVAMCRHGDVLEGYTGEDLKDISKCKRPILPKPDYFGRAKRLVHIELQAGADTETWSTTLAVRDDNCSGVGFMNQSEVWYDLGYMRGDLYRTDKILPAEYNSVVLGWGVLYNQILEPTSDDLNHILVQLNNAGQRKEFVMKAVRTLSRYPDVEVEDGMNPRKAVVALMIVSCESAKLDFLHKSFETNWGTEEMMALAPATSEKMKGYILAWEEMSRTLLHWKYHFYRKWPQSSEQLKQIGITSQILALEAVYLVLNRWALPDQIDVTYTIDDDEEGYTRFIEKLRSTVTSHQYQAAGVLPRPGDGPMWWNVQLKVAGNEEETWTTLALRGDDLRICGFRSHKDNRWYHIEDNRWYQIGHGLESIMFEQEYHAKSISIKSDSMYWPSMTAATARNAVDALSHYSYQLPRRLLHLDGSYMDNLSPQGRPDSIGSALKTLQLMVSYSASIIDVHDAVRQGWQLQGMTAQRDDKLLYLMSFWDGLSISALEQWERHLLQWERHLRKLELRLHFDNRLLQPQGALKVFALIKDAGRDGASTV